MFVDTHAHLHGEEFAEDAEAVLDRARQAGVEQIVLIGDGLASSRTAIQWADKYPDIYAVVGVHPHKAGDWSAEAARELSEEMLKHPKVVGLGEIGLDYHYDFAPRDVQLRAFLEQMEIADDACKPIVIHCREAYEDLLAEVTRFQEERGPGIRPFGIMHCYFGSLDQARQSIDLGFQLGIGGGCTFKKAEELHEVVAAIDLEHLVLETDAPYMAPVPHRGKRNESSYIPLIAARVAELKSLPLEQVERETTANAQRIFKALHGNQR